MKKLMSVLLVTLMMVVGGIEFPYFSLANAETAKTCPKGKFPNQRKFQGCTCPKGLSLIGHKIQGRVTHRQCVNKLRGTMAKTSVIYLPTTGKTRVHLPDLGTNLRIYSTKGNNATPAPKRNIRIRKKIFKGSRRPYFELYTKNAPAGTYQIAALNHRTKKWTPVPLKRLKLVVQDKKINSRLNPEQSQQLNRSRVNNDINRRKQQFGRADAAAQRLNQQSLDTSKLDEFAGSRNKMGRNIDPGKTITGDFRHPLRNGNQNADPQQNNTDGNNKSLGRRTIGGYGDKRVGLWGGTQTQESRSDSRGNNSASSKESYMGENGSNMTVTESEKNGNHYVSVRVEHKDGTIEEESSCSGTSCNESHHSCTGPSCGGSGNESSGNSSGSEESESSGSESSSSNENEAKGAHKGQQDPAQTPNPEGGGECDHPSCRGFQNAIQGITANSSSARIQGHRQSRDSLVNPGYGGSQTPSVQDFRRGNREPGRSTFSSRNCSQMYSENCQSGNSPTANSGAAKENAALKGLQGDSRDPEGPGSSRNTGLGQ